MSDADSDDDSLYELVSDYDEEMPSPPESDDEMEQESGGDGDEPPGTGAARRTPSPSPPPSPPRSPKAERAQTRPPPPPPQPPAEAVQEAKATKPPAAKTEEQGGAPPQPPPQPPAEAVQVSTSKTSSPGEAQPLQPSPPPGPPPAPAPAVVASTPVTPPVAEQALAPTRPPSPPAPASVAIRPPAPLPRTDIPVTAGGKPPQPPTPEMVALESKIADLDQRISRLVALRVPPTDAGLAKLREEERMARRELRELKSGVAFSGGATIAQMREQEQVAAEQARLAQEQAAAQEQARLAQEQTVAQEQARLAQEQAAAQEQTKLAEQAVAPVQATPTPVAATEQPQMVEEQPQAAAVDDATKQQVTQVASEAAAAQAEQERVQQLQRETAEYVKRLQALGPINYGDTTGRQVGQGYNLAEAEQRRQEALAPQSVSAPAPEPVPVSDPIAERAAAAHAYVPEANLLDASKGLEMLGVPPTQGSLGLMNDLAVEMGMAPSEFTRQVEMVAAAAEAGDKTAVQFISTLQRGLIGEDPGLASKLAAVSPPTATSTPVEAPVSAAALPTAIPTGAVPTPLVQEVTSPTGPLPEHQPIRTAAAPAPLRPTPQAGEATAAAPAPLAGAQTTVYEGPEPTSPAPSTTLQAAPFLDTRAQLAAQHTLSQAEQNAINRQYNPPSEEEQKAADAAYQRYHAQLKQAAMDAGTYNQDLARYGAPSAVRESMPAPPVEVAPQQAPQPKVPPIRLRPEHVTVAPQQTPPARRPMMAPISQMTSAPRLPEDYVEVAPQMAAPQPVPIADPRAAARQQAAAELAQQTSQMDQGAAARRERIAAIPQNAAAAQAEFNRQREKERLQQIYAEMATAPQARAAEALRAQAASFTDPRGAKAAAARRELAEEGAAPSAPAAQLVTKPIAERTKVVSSKQAGPGSIVEASKARRAQVKQRVQK